MLAGISWTQAQLNLQAFAMVNGSKRAKIPKLEELYPDLFGLSEEAKKIKEQESEKDYLLNFAKNYNLTRKEVE